MKAKLESSILALVLSLTGTSSFAGGVSDGGGDAIVCKSSWTSFNKTVYLADTFDLVAAGALPERDEVSADAQREAYLKLIMSRLPARGKQISDRVNSLKFVATDEKLPILRQYNIPISQRNCHREQLAIQNVETGVVRYNAKLYSLLSKAEQALLKIHEAIISIEQQTGDTILVRNEVSNIGGSGDFKEFLLETVIDKKFVPRFWLAEMYWLSLMTWKIQGPRVLSLSGDNIKFVEFLSSQKHFAYMKQGLNYESGFPEASVFTSILNGFFHYDSITGVKIGAPSIIDGVQNSNDVLGFCFRVISPIFGKMDWMQIGKDDALI